MRGAKGREDPERKFQGPVSDTPTPGCCHPPISQSWAVTLRSPSLIGDTLDTEGHELHGMRRRSQMCGHLLTGLESARSPQLLWQ